MSSREDRVKLTNSHSSKQSNTTDDSQDNANTGSQNRQDPAVPSKPGKSNTPLIVGVIVGVVGGLVLIGLMSWLCYRKRRKHTHQAVGSHAPVRHVVREEDAGEVFECLPPEYNEAWERSGDTPSGAGSTPTGDSYTPSFSSSASAGPLVTPTGSTEPKEPISPLKRAYMRTFSRSRPQPANDAHRSGNLQEEYKRMVERRGNPQQPSTRDPDSKHQ